MVSSQDPTNFLTICVDGTVLKELKKSWKYNIGEEKRTGWGEEAPRRRREDDLFFFIKFHLFFFPVLFNFFYYLFLFFYYLPASLPPSCSWVVVTYSGGAMDLQRTAWRLWARSSHQSTGERDRMDDHSGGQCKIKKNIHSFCVLFSSCVKKKSACLLVSCNNFFCGHHWFFFCSMFKSDRNKKK